MPVNGKRYEHFSTHGTKFIAERADLSKGVRVYPREGNCEAQLLADTAEMIADHCLGIRPQLDGFAGYAGIDFCINCP